MHFLENVKNLAEKKYKFIIISFFILFLIIGILIVKDYGYSTDEEYERELGNDASNLVLKNDTSLFGISYMFHGTAFTFPLTIMQKIFNIENPRTTFLLRHYSTFLLFYIAVIFFYLLCKKIFKDWKFGFLASIFLVLSPRIFVDSFYNPKDLPFLSFFIISIFTLQRFFETKNIKFAFLHGFASGFAVASRIIGIIIPFFTILFFIADLLIEKKQLREDSKTQRSSKKIQYLLIYLFITITVFLILMPAMLPDPLNNFIAAIRRMSDYPLNARFLYMGQNISSLNNLPWHYLPVNIIIMTPIAYTVLFFIGLAFFISNIRKNILIFYIQNKYIIIAVLWFFIPVFAAILLKSNLYNGWRQMYFIYPAFLIIALKGVNSLYGIFRQKLALKTYNCLAAVITVFLIFNSIFILQLMIKEHPYQYIYHNIIAGKNLIEVKDDFTLDYWGLSFKDGLDYILKTDNRIRITYTSRNSPKEKSEYLLSEQDSKRLVFVTDINEADYFLNHYKSSDIRLELQGIKQEYLINKVYSLTVGGAEIMTVFKLR